MSTPSRHRGFTIAESVAVMVVLAVLAATVTPALTILGNTRNGALVNEVERRLSLARCWAMSTGQPAGVKFDAVNQRLSLVRVASTGAAPSALPSVTGGAASTAADDIKALVPGTSLVSLTTSPTGFDTIWFDYVGTPHVRTSAGVYSADLAADATVTLSGSKTLTVRQVTGLIEK